MKEYARNAKAVLDSLSRFEFTKARYANLLNQYAQEQQRQLTLLVRIEQLERQNEQLSKALTKTETQLAEEIKKRKGKGWENWFWRALAAGFIYERSRH
ncbi:hypothetical protein [Siphonobacter sp. SORGH_AS_0500]|uniref:hypothetical protein n=1 Tax=Siphonobacter sp. SORGH_AS_0500 TaxID=1864824 RepID=UPI002854748B|nr:hypothetical protein [Siphonobacter sp. SORGH_AS_0500]MDR6195933.1 Glu-tRNA(Gln) amidotransferase subunit E-like FAD-binding protein [Siphonobacter sp. SORGH_AS_0500]